MEDTTKKHKIIAGGIYAYDRAASKTGKGVAVCVAAVDSIMGLRSGCFIMAHKVPQTIDENDPRLEKYTLVGVLSMAVCDPAMFQTFVESQLMLPEQAVPAPKK